MNADGRGLAELVALSERLRAASSALWKAGQAGKSSRNELASVLAAHGLEMAWAELPANGTRPVHSTFHRLCELGGKQLAPTSTHDPRLRGKRALISDAGAISNALDSARDSLDFLIAAARREQEAARPARMARAAAALAEPPEHGSLGRALHAPRGGSC